MKIKSLMLLGMAVCCGLVAMLGVQQVLSKGKKTVDDRVKVYVAAQEIAANTILDDSLLKTELWPKASLPKGVITDPKKYAERAIKVRAFPGDLILEAKLGDKGQTGPSISIPKGMRVVSVPVNLTSANSGMILPGDRVDVLVTYRSQSTGRDTMQKTKTILEFIEVFAVDKVRESDSEASDKTAKASLKNISFVVTPQQCNLLMLAVSKGTLQLALRNAEDKEKGETVAVDDTAFDASATEQGAETDEDAVATTEDSGSVKEFLDQDAAPAPADAAPPAPAKNIWTMTIFEGTEKKVELIELPLEPDAAVVTPAIPETTAVDPAPATTTSPSL